MWVMIVMLEPGYTHDSFTSSCAFLFYMQKVDVTSGIHATQGILKRGTPKRESGPYKVILVTGGHMAKFDCICISQVRILVTQCSLVATFLS